MTGSVVVYGFGSFFSNSPQSNDVDLLLVHEDTTVSSCALAIRCKQILLQVIDSAHITLLSKDEESELDFITRAQANPIGHIEQDQIVQHIESICCQLKVINEAQSQTRVRS